MANTESPAKHLSEDPSSRSNGNDARPGSAGGATRFPQTQEQAADRLSLPRETTPEVGTDDYRETMDAVGRLAGKVAHHLNNLLAVVDGNASFLEEALELARDEALEGASQDPRFTSELREIRNACARASGLTTQLRSISGSRWSEPRVVDLRTLVLDMDLGRFFSDDVGFWTDFASKTCPVRVDPGHLEEVVFGLVLNAREAVGGGGTVRIAIDNLSSTKVDGSAAEGWVQLEVSDSGEGMDEEALSRVFQPYFSTHSYSEDRGLGLSVACGVVRQSGGNMKVFSTPGGGTTVRVRLPVAASFSVSNRQS